jgi:hypothetical protein
MHTQGSTHGASASYLFLNYDFKPMETVNPEDVHGPDYVGALDYDAPVPKPKKTKTSKKAVLEQPKTRQTRSSSPRNPDEISPRDRAQTALMQRLAAQASANESDGDESRNSHGSKGDTQGGDDSHVAENAGRVSSSRSPIQPPRRMTKGETELVMKIKYEAVKLHREEVGKRPMIFHEIMKTLSNLSREQVYTTEDYGEKNECPLKLLKQIKRTHATGGFEDVLLDMEVLNHEFQSMHMYANETLFSFYERMTRVLDKMDRIGYSTPWYIQVMTYLDKL